VNGVLILTLTSTSRRQKAEETVTKINKDEEEDVESPATNSDISRRRLNHLKTVLKIIL